MEHDAGIDMWLEQSSVCVVDSGGRIVREAKVASEPEALIAWFAGFGFGFARVGLEAGPLSQWLYAGLRARAGELRGLERRVRRLARDDARARLLLSTPGVGAIVALTDVAAIDDPGRLRSSKAAGAHFGLTPKKYHSGETDITGRVSKVGAAGVRAVLYEAAHRDPDPPGQGRGLEELGDAAGRPRRDAQGQGGARPQAGRRPAPHAGRRHDLQRREGRRGPSRLRRPGDDEFGRHDTRRPEQGPFAGTMDQARPRKCQRRHQGNRALLDRPTSSSSNPTRWRPGADPGQKRDPGERIEAPTEG
jgi:Transposase IS116/IS110/IS902 family